MPHFDKDGFRTPFGKNTFLRSTRNVKTVSRMFARETLPDITIDGVTQKVLQPGTVLAKITSGANVGMVGPFRGVGTAEVQTLTESGTISGGTYTLTVLGATTDAIAFDAVAADIQAAIRAAVDEANPDEPAQAAGITVTGGPVHTTPVVVTFTGDYGAVAAITVGAGSLTGSTPGISVAETTPGTAGASDGRGVLANIVGICNTFLPSQLMYRDVEVAVVVEAMVYQNRCFELNAAGIAIPLTDTTAAQMFAKKHLDIRFQV
jgi:hypothetical protein